MKKTQRWCPQCEHMVELERGVSGGVEVFKCCNCAAMYMHLNELPLKPQRREADAVTAKK